MFPLLSHRSGLLPRLTNGFTLNSVYRFNSGQSYTDFQPVNIDGFTADSSFCDGSFNSDFNIGVTVDTCRMVLSNKKAPINTVAYLNPYTGPTVNGSPTLGTPEFVTYQSDYVDSSGTYHAGTLTDPKTAHWIIDNTAYALLVGNPYPGSGRGINRGDTYSELDATLIKSTHLAERATLELSMAAYNALNQAYRGAPGSFVANSFTFGTTAYNDTGTVPSSTGLISGNRFVVLGAKVVF
jgi:hypothetical protein